MQAQLLLRSKFIKLKLKDVALVLAITLFSGFAGHAQTITTVAGDNTSSFDGDTGPATDAGIQLPCRIAFDASGNMYISEAKILSSGINSVVRKVDATGTINTIAGMGSASTSGGYSGDGGAATDAKLKVPDGLQFDAMGNLYIADRANGVIRKVDPSGNISTVAGTHLSSGGGFGGDGGQATASDVHMYLPSGIGFDSRGDLLIADFNNGRIRMVDTTGVINTIAGGADYTTTLIGDSTQATDARFANPTDVALDAAGNIYIADAGNNIVRKITKDGIINTVAGNYAFLSGLNGIVPGAYYGDGGAATDAALNKPTGLAFDAVGNLYIADNANNVIREMNTKGIISTIAGNNAIGGTYAGDGGPATAAALNKPYGLAFDASGNLYISDQNNYVVRKISQDCSNITAGSITANGTNSFCSFGSDTLMLPTASAGIDVSYKWLYSTDSINWMDTGNAYTSWFTGNLTATAYYKAVVGCGLAVHDTTPVFAVTVTPNSVFTPTVSIDASTTNIYTCSPVTFTATPVNGGSAPSYQWVKDGNNVGTNNSVYVDSSLNNNDMIYCVMTSNLNCATTTLIANSDTITMTVSPVISSDSVSASIDAPLQSSVPVTGDTVATCQGTPVVFTNIPVMGGTNPSYQWLKNGNVVSSDSVYTASDLANNDVITCKMTSSISCAMPATVTSNSFTMKITPSVVPSVTLSCINCSASSPGDTNAICATQFPTFEATATNGGDTPEFNWIRVHNGNTNVETTVSNVFSFNGAGFLGYIVDSDQVICELISDATCALLNLQISPLYPMAFSDTITMDIIPALAATINVSADTVCSGTLATFTASGTNGSSAPSYQWTKNGVVAGTTSATYTDNSLNDSDLIICTLTSSNASCADTASDTVIAVVYPLPVPVITANNNVLSAGVFAAYQWSDTAIITGATDSAYTPTHNGDYTVTVTDSNGCMATSAVYMDTALSVAYLNSSYGVKIYPNPSTGIIYIESPVSVAADVSSVDGKIVLHQENAKMINISNLANGMYLINVYSKGRSIVKIEKLVKE